MKTREKILIVSIVSIALFGLGYLGYRLRKNKYKSGDEQKNNRFIKLIRNKN